jgi:hypothetical protein
MGYLSLQLSQLHLSACYKLRNLRAKALRCHRLGSKRPDLQRKQQPHAIGEPRSKTTLPPSLKENNKKIPRLNMRCKRCWSRGGALPLYSRTLCTLPSTSWSSACTADQFIFAAALQLGRRGRIRTECSGAWRSTSLATKCRRVGFLR